MVKHGCFAVIISFLLIPSFSAIPLHHLEHEELVIDIDAHIHHGRVKYFADINDGPIPVNKKDGKNVARQYHEIGIKYIRTHDFYGPTDISTIFPNWSRDADDASSYNFSSSDEVISSIAKENFRIFYRLGESASDNDSKRMPPANFTKWAEVCKHIVMHYNDGWANGHHYNITYWEIWNEPDLKGFWNGSAEQYYHLYEITARTLKSYNDSIKVGGPCTSDVTNENYTTRFLDYVVSHNIPLDFFSWHLYANSPSQLLDASLHIRHILDEHGLKDCENINTEWNINILSPQRDKDNAKNAAFTASSFIAFQNSSIEHAFRYRGTQDNSWLIKLLGFDLSLFTEEGKYKTPALSYLAMHYMEEHAPFLSSLHVEGNGVSYMASVSEDGSRIAVLISNFNGDDRAYKINLRNVNGKAHVSACYVIDDFHHLEVVSKENFSSSNYSMENVIKKNSVHFIFISSNFLPENGPETAKIPFILRLKFLDPFLRLLGYFILGMIFG